jgi:GNAT superfamily N-acetyltransferase
VRRDLGDGFVLDDDPQRVDIDAVHAFISEQSYWGIGRARDLVARAVAGSTRVVGLYRGAEQVGFARAVSDRATVAYLADVYVLPEHRGRGLGLELVREIVDGSFPDVCWLLHTADAQSLYARIGFIDAQPPHPLMERRPAQRKAGERPREQRVSSRTSTPTPRQ